ncbi:MAG: hypothetical protein AAGA90_09500 [Actinomycetota bacterium]
MKLDKFRAQAAPLLDAGETVAAVAKVTPRGAAHEAILRGAGGAGGLAAGPALAGAGAAIGSAVGEQAGDAGREERDDAGLDVGNAMQVIFAVTDRRIVLLKRSALGKPKELLAALEREHVTGVVMGSTKLFGQTMPEIQLTLASGAEAGFGVAKVDRKDGDAVVAALGG